MHPPEAKKEAEIYDKIMAWEREIKEQEKVIPLDQRPLISNPMKITIIKNISCGVIKDYIKTYEAITGYDEIRNKVLQMSVFAKTENNIKTHKPEAMDISQIMQESLQKIKEKDCL